MRFSVFIKKLKGSLNIFDLLFFVLLIASVTINTVSIKKHLVFTMPLSIICVLLSYIFYRTNKLNYYYIIGLIALFSSDILASLDFKNHFSWITILNFIYLTCCTLALKKYITLKKINDLISFTSIIAVSLIGYVLFSITNLLFSALNNYSIFFTFLLVFSVSIFLITISLIYLSVRYKTGATLLAAGIFYLFQVCLSAINEFLNTNKVFLMIILICHVLSVLFFKNFLANTHPLGRD